MKKLSFTMRNKKGSALLIAILIMGILMTLTLGLSDLVIREIRQTTDLVSAGQAYFAAEAGVENALLDLHDNFPGYETASTDSSPCSVLNSTAKKYTQVPDDGVTGSKLFFDKNHPPCYAILNKASSVPAFDPDQPIFLTQNGQPGDVPTNINFVYSAHADATYNELPLSQSVVIPLYSDDNGIPQPVTQFLIEYYVDYKNPDLLNTLMSNGISPQDLVNLDVLRWKIFGNSPTATAQGASTQTDSISDFFPSSSEASYDNPMCIGTDQDLQPSGGCLFPFFDPNGSTDSANKGAAVGVLWGAARQCYLSDSGSQSAQGRPIQSANQGGCTISNFIASHSTSPNYLVLTNVINPDVILTPGTDIKSAKAQKELTIHYRVIAQPGPTATADQSNTGNPKLVRQAASISADGYAAGAQVKQSIDVQIDQSSFLPVFNFSLYQTCTTAACAKKEVPASAPNNPFAGRTL